jgi:uncharacterized protein (DUF927 family)
MAASGGIPIPWGRSLTEADYEVLCRSWISAELAQQALLRRVDSQEGAQIVGRRNDGSYCGIVYPNVWPGEEFVREYRLRRDHPPVEPRGDGTFREVQKYLSPPGTRSMLYIVPGTQPALLADTQLPIIVTEGEKKAIALHRLALAGRTDDAPRFLPIGLPGVWNFRGTVGKSVGPNGDRRDVKGVITDFGRLNLARKVVVAFDSNVHRNSEVRRARAALRTELERRGASVYYLEVPELSSVNGVDDWLAAVGPEPVLRALESVHPAGSPRPPKGFKVTDGGVYAASPGDKEHELWISDRFDVLARVRDESGDSWGYLVRWWDADRNEHVEVLNCELFGGRQSDWLAKLMAGGMRIATAKKCRDLLMTYILNSDPEERAVRTESIGWHGDRYVLPDHVFGPAGERFIPSNRDCFQGHKFRVSGTVDDWRLEVGSRCAGNSRLVFAICTAFAPPLLSLLGESGGGFHLCGPSSTGKTTALHVAGSVWGGGGDKGYLRTWKSTANGLEALAALHNHALLCLDEFGQADPREAGECAYALANGLTKTRATRLGGVRRGSEFLLLFLSNGETSLNERMKQAGQHMRGGQEVRMCDLCADAGMGLGLFEVLGGTHTAAEFAEQLAEACRRNYGTPIRAFLMELSHKRETAVKRCRELIAKFRERFEPLNATGEVHRACSRFAICAAAGEWASELGITGWMGGEALEGVGRCFRDWMKSRGTTGPWEAMEGARRIRNFLLEHGETRFSGDAKAPVLHRAGYYKESDDGRLYYFFPHVLRDQVCVGLDWRSTIRVLAEIGYLVHGQGRYESKPRLPTGETAWVYVIRGAITEMSDDGNCFV